ncbi:thrombospondin, partial [Micromonospora phytophila]|nr:thrombospondin [Micromonospora phytophila]
MVKIPSLSRRTEPAPTNGDSDGRAEDAGRISRPAVTDRDEEATTYRSSAAPGADDGGADDGGADDGGADAERRAAERAAVARAATGRPADADTRHTPH